MHRCSFNNLCSELVGLFEQWTRILDDPSYMAGPRTGLTEYLVWFPPIAAEQWLRDRNDGFWFHAGNGCERGWYPRFLEKRLHKLLFRHSSPRSLEKNLEWTGRLGEHYVRSGGRGSERRH